MQFLRSNTTFAPKITLPGPFTMTQQAKNEFYKDDEEMAMDFAAAVNAEALDLQAAKRYAVRAINRALEGITVPTAVPLCFGYAAVVKVTVTTTPKKGFVVGMRSMPGNPYDGHTLEEAIWQVSIFSEQTPKSVIVNTRDQNSRVFEYCDQDRRAVSGCCSRSCGFFLTAKVNVTSWDGKRQLCGLLVEALVV